MRIINKNILKKAGVVLSKNKVKMAEAVAAANTLT
jgi:hypothetical protein